MELIAAWKQSLQLFEYANFNQFIKDSRKALWYVYKGWLFYCLWPLALVVTVLFSYPSFKHLPYALYGILACVSLLSAFSIMMLCAIVHDALHARPFTVAAHKRHIIIGTIFLALIFMKLLLGVYCILEDQKHHLFTALMDTIKRGRSLGYHLPHTLRHFIRINVEFFLIHSLVFFLLFEPIIVWVGFIFFAFLQRKPTCGELVKSIGRACEFIVYNLPALLMVGALILAGLFLAGTIIYAFTASLFVVAIVHALAFFIYLPLLMTINGQLYKKYGE